MRMATGNAMLISFANIHLKSLMHKVRTCTRSQFHHK